MSVVTGGHMIRNEFISGDSLGMRVEKIRENRLRLFGKKKWLDATENDMRIVGVCRMVDWVNWKFIGRRWSTKKSWNEDEGEEEK
ncbi:Hypothetical protein CINCED_3A023566 [Cinara cedri]|uniref:Uncharacterized protein n=1 Tax=Cinara cedri TaxID=506608 RepID=A0A5E4MLK1_9HEMI|nr:Hypothetical protein CINCED_3A023566 [Cinara cedri]